MQMNDDRNLRTGIAGILPLSLRPFKPSRLVRIGAQADGGYLVDPRDVASADGLISFGVDRDWSFEKAFLRRNRVPVHVYDGCTNIPYLLSDIPRAVRDRNWRWACRAILKTADYLRFFSASARHFRCFVGTGEFAYQGTAAPVVSIETVFDNMRAAGSSRPFLKVDIEGAEFCMLQQFIDRAAVTAGLAIEFHNCDARLREVVEFVQRYPLRLVHIHANSYGGIGRTGVPRALELTFSSTHDMATGFATTPHPLDRANDGHTDIPIRFA